MRRLDKHVAVGRSAGQSDPLPLERWSSSRYALMPVDIPPTGDAPRSLIRSSTADERSALSPSKTSATPTNTPSKPSRSRLYRMVCSRVVLVLRLSRRRAAPLADRSPILQPRRFRRADALLVAGELPHRRSAPSEVETQKNRGPSAAPHARGQELIRMRPDLPGEAADFVAHLGALDRSPILPAISLQKKPERQRLLENMEVRNRVELALIYLARARDGGAR